MDLDLAKQLERRLGRQKIPLEQQGQRIHREENLMNEDQIIKIPDGSVMCFHSNLSGFCQQVTPHYKNRNLRAKTKFDPYPEQLRSNPVPSIKPDLNRLAALTQSLDPEARTPLAQLRSQPMHEAL